MTKTSLKDTNSEDHRLLDELSKVVTTDAELLLIGLPSVKKERYARHIHDCSFRKNAAFVSIDCRTATKSLGRVLFDNARGNLNNPGKQSVGVIAAAEGGTLFLDEIDSLTMSCQVLFLRFLQEKKYRQPGETRISRANVRFIAATSTDITAAVRDGRFRQDLLNFFTTVQLDRPADPEEPSPTEPSSEQPPQQNRRRLWPFGLLSALLFVPATWIVFWFITLILQDVHWSDLVVNSVLL